MRVIVTGGRAYNKGEVVFNTLNKLHKKTPITTMVQGGAQGADRLARLWARKKMISIVSFHPDWEKLGKIAGPIRNALMAEAGADLIVAFPGGRGTADMIETGEEWGIPIIVMDGGEHEST